MKIYNKTYLFNWDINKNNLNAFTIAEVVITTVISAIILSFILIFMFDITDWIKESKKEVQSMKSLYEIITKLNNISSLYSSGFVIGWAVNGSDILYLRNIEWTDWMLIWPVNTYNNTIDTDTSTYGGRAIWFKRLFPIDITEIEADNTKILSYVFLPDKVYYDLDLHSLEFVSYNSWKVIDLTLVFDINHNQDLIWTPWSTLSKESLRTFNINF